MVSTIILTTLRWLAGVFPSVSRVLSALMVIFQRMRSTSSQQGRLISTSSPHQVQARLVVKYGRGVGVNSHVAKEVVHLSMQIMNSSGSSDIVQSDDAFEPSCFHASRRWGLAVANARQSEVEELGFGGPAVVYRIPGIPFPQEQDAGLHISLYNQPRQDGASYVAPDLEKCTALEGEIFTVTIDGTLKILNGSEQNDSKVGGCYYISLACGACTRNIARNIRDQVCLPRDETQQFHLSLAVIAPAWLPCHTKSAIALQATPEQLELWRKHLQVFRRGEQTVGFNGFDDNETTDWTSHANKVAEACKKNAMIKAAIDALKMSDDHDTRKHELQQQIINIQSYGFCKTVGSQETIAKINQPDVRSQQVLIKNIGVPGRESKFSKRLSVSACLPTALLIMAWMLGIQPLRLFVPHSNAITCSQTSVQR